MQNDRTLEGVYTGDLNKIININKKQIDRDTIIAPKM